MLRTVVTGFDFPTGEHVARIAGEANTLEPIRRGLGLPEARIKFDGYWPSGTVDLHFHDPDGED